MTEVRYQKTTLTRPAARAAVQEAFTLVFGRAPGTRELAILLAQSEHETGAWRSMPNHNWGGIKAFSSWTSNPRNLFVHLMTTEGHGAAARRVSQPFRAYATAADGCRDWLETLARLWPEALSAARAGDVREFVERLGRGKKGAYFTGDPRVYVRSVEKLMERWLEEAEHSPASEPTRPEGTAPPPPPVTVSIPGYRRARQAEVTIEMENAALKALRSMDLGEHRIFDDFALAAETHSNARKGISVFLPMGERE